MYTEFTPLPHKVIRTISGLGDETTDVWGRQKMSVDYSLFHGLFTFTVPSRSWTAEKNGVEISLTEEVSSVDSMLVVRSGTVDEDEVLLQSKRHPRYQPNRGHFYSVSAILDNPTEGQVDFGLFTNSENGVFFRRKNNGKLYACLVSNYVLIREEEITNLPPDYDMTKGNIYDIRFQWRGVGNYFFYIGDASRGGILVLVHTLRLLNTLTGLSLQNPALCVSFRATNVEGQQGQVRCGCVDVTSEGGNIVREQYASYNKSALVSSGNPIGVNYVPKLTPSGKINTRDVGLYRISGNADKKGKLVVYITRDPSAVPGGEYASLAPDSFIQEKTPTSIDPLKMQLITKIAIEANGSNFRESPSPQNIDFYLTRGDHLVLVWEGSNSSNIDVVVEFGEEV